MARIEAAAIDTTLLSPFTIHSEGHGKLGGMTFPSMNALSGKIFKLPTARVMARNVACKILNSSISFTEEKPMPKFALFVIFS